MKAHLIAIGALLLLIIALFWRVFFFGETLIDLATHDNQLPWGAAVSTYDGYPYSRRDLTDTYVTRDYFIVDSYRNKELPLWNPYIFSGHPMYADGVTKLFSPTNLLYCWFDIPLGYSLSRLLELICAAIFLYLFLVNLRLGAGGAFTGCVVFLLSDHVMQHLTWLGWLGGLMWLPLMLLGADRALRQRRIRPAIGAGVALAMQFYCGYMPTSIYYLTALALYYLASPWLIATAETRIDTLKQALKYLIVSLLIGFGLSALIWLPILELLSYSNRKIVPTEIDFIWLPPWQMLTLLLPRAFGRAFDPQIARRFLEVGVSQDRSVYLGLITLGIIGGGFWGRGKIFNPEQRESRESQKEIKTFFISVPSVLKNLLLKPAEEIDRRIYYFAGLAIGALMVMMCAPIYVHVTKYLPVLKTIRAVTRISGLYAFGAAVLAGYGAARLLSAPRSLVLAYLKKISAIGLALVSLLIAATLIFSTLGGYLPQDHEQGNRVRRWGLKILISLNEHFRWQNIELLVPLGVMALMIFFCWYFPRRQWSLATFYLIMLALLMGELIWNNNQYNPTFARAQIFPATTATDFLKKNIDQYRLVVAPPEFSGKSEISDGHKIVAPPNTLVPYKLATIAGKDQLFPKWYRELTALVEPQKYLSHIVFNRTYAPLYDLLAVKYLVTRDVHQVEEANYREVFQGDGVRVYENLNVMPRAFFANKVATVARVEDGLALMKEDGFDPHALVVVVREKPLDNIEAPVTGDRVEITSYKNNEVVLQASSAGKRLLVLSDTYYPGWEVSIDGAPAELLRANHAMRAVILKAGEHQVKFIFRPRSFRYGLAIGFTTLLISLALIALRR